MIGSSEEGRTQTESAAFHVSEIGCNSDFAFKEYEVAFVFLLNSK